MILPFCRHSFCAQVTLRYPSDVRTHPSCRPHMHAPWVLWVASSCKKRDPFFRLSDFPTFRHVPGSVIGLATAPVPPPATHTGRRSISAESGGQLVTNSFSWSGLKLKDSNQGFIFANPAGMIQNNSWFSSKFGWKSSLILKNGIKLSIVLHMYNSFFFGKSPFMMVQDFCKRGTIRECNPESNY